MNAFLPPLPVLVLQWTLLLTLGWLIHWQVRQRHPRWRLILWRSILCFGLLLPLLNIVRLPRWSVPPPRFAVEPRAPGATPAPAARSMEASPARGSQAGRPVPVRTTNDTTAVIDTAPAPTTPVVAAEPAPRLTVWQWLGLAWLVGCAWYVLRLLAQQIHLWRLSRRAQKPDAGLQALARLIQSELGVRREVRVRLVDGIASPFLCGVLRPTILIPRALAGNLPRTEVSALLTHELAHEVRHDLAWCIAWRWMKALCWFHPLVWRAPEAHVLACEEEADRVAAGRTYGEAGYAQLLAQLALRVLRVPAIERGLALHATSHLSRRLLLLGREKAAAWRAWHSLTGFAGAVGLLVLTAGWQFAQVAAPAAEAVATDVPTQVVVVTVIDENGKPVAGATITPDGMRATDPRVRGSHYGWRPVVHGPVVKAMTNAEGKAEVKYPVAIIPEEKILTGEISFSVEHPEFGPARPTSFRVDGTTEPVRLKRGIPIRVAGHFGPQRERVTEIVPLLLGEPMRLEDWERDERGGLTWRRMSPGKHYLYLTGRLPSGEIVHSKGIAFFSEQRDSHNYELEMMPGIRVEGRLDAKVPRPVRNGWVQLSVHDEESDTREARIARLVPRGGNTGFWISHRPIAADGSFAFESVPSGELKAIVHGDGFISVSEPEPSFSRAGLGAPSEPPRPITRAVPQSFAGKGPLTKIEIATEATANVRVKLTHDGHPVAGAKVYVSPNVIQMPSGSRLFAKTVRASDASFRTLPVVPDPVFTATTNPDGVAELRNVPSFEAHLTVMHDTLEVPLRSGTQADVRGFRQPPNRWVDLMLLPGQDATVEVALHPKGHEFLGEKP
jgi:beta-lactamase regulating signal transducer with metallopeptidase domain